MKNIWKWTLGIVLVLVVVAALVAVPFVMHNTLAANFNRTTLQVAPGANPQAPGWNNGPMLRGDYDGQRPGRAGFEGRKSPMMGGGRYFERDFSRFGGFTPFGFGFMFLGGLLRLIPLVLFGLLLFGVYQLGKRAGMRSALGPASVATPASEGDEKPAA